MATVTMNGIEVYLDTRTTAAWTALSRVLPKGYPCAELTDDGKCKLKIGDGVLPFSSLPYVGGDIDLTAYYTKSETDAAISSAISSMGTLFKLKGRVDAVSDLPASDNEQGDVYLIGAADASEFEEYYWTGTMWDFMGKTGSIDLSSYYTKSEVDVMVGGLGDRISAIEGDYIKSTDKLILSCSIS